MVSDDEDDVPQIAPSQSLIARTTVPPYGQRPGWKPSNPEDFGKQEVLCLGLTKLILL